MKNITFFLSVSRPSVNQRVTFSLQQLTRLTSWESVNVCNEELAREIYIFIYFNNRISLLKGCWTRRYWSLLAPVYLCFSIVDSGITHEEFLVQLLAFFVWKAYCSVLSSVCLWGQCLWESEKWGVGSRTAMQEVAQLPLGWAAVSFGSHTHLLCRRTS